MTTKKSIEKEESFKDLIGKSFYIRTVTYHWVGRIVSVFNENFLELEEASWIPDSARFMNTIKDGEMNEVEPVGSVFVNTETIVDFIPWVHALPKDQK
jgi:hypothetical protein